MKNIKIIFSIILALACFSACQRAEVFPESKYSCTLSTPDETATHPKAAIYQDVIDKNVAKGILGTSVYIRDQHGSFLGVGGFADVASDVKLQPCNQFIIGSITKPITATCVFSYIEDGVLTLDDFLTQWIDKSITDRLPNGDEIQIKHLLSHRAGLPDHYDFPYYFDNLNKDKNILKQEDYLEYIFDKDPVGAVGEKYEYANGGYVLLGMVLESATDKKLEQIYKEKIFEPLNLMSGYYSAEQPIPDGLVKGYLDLNGNGELVESEFFYEEELNTADGAICMNPQDLGRFIEAWAVGNIISAQGVEDMQTWFLFPDAEEDDEDKGYGYGFDKLETPHGDAVGHTGGVAGFGTVMQYFPEQNATFIVFSNSIDVKNGDAYGDLLEGLRDEMFR